MTTEPKAKGVDVLAIMLADAADAYSYRRHIDADRGKSVKEDSAAARTAVAELIEAANEAAAFVGYYGVGAEAVKVRLVSALKRIAW